MNLNTHDRLILLGTLPKEGDFATLKIVRQLREDLSFSEEEIKRLHLQRTPEGYTWEPGADVPRDIAIGEKATDIIVEALQHLNAEKRLTESHYALYERFVEQP